MEVERALVDRLVLDALGPHDLVEYGLAVLAEPELDQGVAASPPGRALAQEAETPRIEPRIGREPHPDRRLGAPQRLPEHARRPRRRPCEGGAGRDDPRVPRGGLDGPAAPFLPYADLAARPRPAARRGHAHDPSPV